jgi:DNA-binding CsgD family transcriptional regulator
MSLLETIDSVYAASLDRFLWPEAVDRASVLFGANTGLLLTHSPEAEGWRIIASSGLPETFVSSYNSRWGRMDPFLGRDASALGDGVTVRSVNTEDHHASPFGMYFCEPAGFRVGLLAGTAERGGLSMIFWRSSTQAFGVADKQQLGRLWPHIVRASTIQSGSWQGSQMPSPGWAVSLLDLWHVGVVGFSAGGKQVYSNRAARQLASCRDGLSFAIDGPVASSVADTRSLRELVRQLADGTRPGPEWLRLSRPSGALSYEVTLCRSIAQNRDDPRVTMFVAAPDETVVCDPVVLRRLHSLTELEAGVAVSVAKAMPIPAIAAELDLSIQTARWYVQHVREKMEAASQGHLVRMMLRGLAAIEWPPIPLEPKSR